MRKFKGMRETMGRGELREDERERLSCLYVAKHCSILLWVHETILRERTSKFLHKRNITGCKVQKWVGLEEVCKMGVGLLRSPPETAVCVYSESLTSSNSLSLFR